MAGACIIVAYRPKPGKEEALLELVRARVPTLRNEGLVTDRKPVKMCKRETARLSKCRNGIGRGNRRRAQEPERAGNVGKFYVVAIVVPLKHLAEADELFAGFEPVDD